MGKNNFSYLKLKEKIYLITPEYQIYAFKDKNKELMEKALKSKKEIEEFIQDLGFKREIKIKEIKI